MHMKLTLKRRYQFNKYSPNVDFMDVQNSASKVGSGKHFLR